VAVTKLFRHQTASLVGFLLLAGVIAVLVFAPGVVKDVFVNLIHAVTGR